MDPFTDVTSAVVHCIQRSALMGKTQSEPRNDDQITTPINVEIAHYEGLLEAHATEGHEDEPLWLTGLSKSLATRYQCSGSLGDLADAIAHQEQAVDLTRDDHPNKCVMLSSLGNLCSIRFERLRDPTDIKDAISSLQEAVALATDGDKPALLNDLGNLFIRRFQQLGNLQDIDEAIASHRQALDLTPDGDPEKPNRLDSYGSSLCKRFERFGRPDDIENAITVQRRAVDLALDVHKPTFFNDLGNSFLRRFKLLHNLEDISEAITAHHQAVDFTPDGHITIPMRLNTYSTSLCSRFERSGASEDIENAIIAQRRASDLIPEDHAMKPMLLNNLGNCLYLRFKKWRKDRGREDAASSSTDGSFDLEEAVSVQRRSIKDTPNGHTVSPSHFHSFGVTLTTRFEELHNLSDIEEAISVLQKAVALVPEGHIDKPGWFHSLGTAFLCRFEHAPVGDVLDLKAALFNYRSSALSPVGSARTLFEAARTWAKCSLRHDDEPSIEAYRTVVSLIPRVVWLGTTVFTRFESVSLLGDVVSEAAAVAIQLEQYSLSIEWLEQGRSIIWRQILHLRTPLDELRASGNEKLAEELEQVSLQLECAGTMKWDESLRLNPNSERDLEEEGQVHRRLARRYEDLLDQVRQVPGFKEFLLPKKFSYLRGAARAASSSVILVNVHETRCDALVVRNHHLKPVLHVPLPSLTLDAANILYASSMCFQESSHHFTHSHPPTSTEVVESPRPPMHFLQLLWRYVVQPVLTMLNVNLSPGDTKLPHVTWCPTGPLTFLPFHAAGDYTSPHQPKIFQYVVSSYTPTLTALIEASRRSSDILEPTILAVSQPNTPGCSKLPGTVKDVFAIRKYIDDSKLKWLNDKEATVDAVLDGMKKYDWCHLACHAVQDRLDPSKSGFALHDGALDLRTIIQQSFPSAKLAFLCGCQTAAGDTERPEESLHLAAGMLVAGYQTVIGAMRSIGDNDASYVTKELYSSLLNRSRVEKGDAALALHNAVQMLRERVGEEAYVKWAPFIHVGV